MWKFLLRSEVCENKLESQSYKFVYGRCYNKETGNNES